MYLVDPDPAPLQSLASVVTPRCQGCVVSRRVHESAGAHTRAAQNRRVHQDLSRLYLGRGSLWPYGAHCHQGRTDLIIIR